MHHAKIVGWVVAGIYATAATGADGGEGVGATRQAAVAIDDPLGEAVKQVVYLDQGWTADQSLRFYSTPQGSLIIPYDWFLALEQPDSTTPFRDDRNILKFRYLPQRPAADSANPDGLPVGFVADTSRGLRWLGMTCAACHTSEIRYGSTGYRIDGAPTQGDIRALISSMIEALRNTHDDPAKFDRFARRVLGERDLLLGRDLLRWRLDKMIGIRVGYNRRNFPGYDPAQPAPPPADYGRLDALGAIVNEVYFHAQESARDPIATSQPANAPVSYPFLWDTPGQNLVQWVGLPNGGPATLARNAGEVLGVFADFEVPQEFRLLGYRSSVEVMNLVALEHWIEGLRAPRWPAGFPAIDQAAADRGKTLYDAQCVSCHVVIPPGSSNPANVAYLAGVGTDPLTYTNLFTRSGPSGKLEGAFVKVVPILGEEKIPAQADALMLLTNEVIGTILDFWIKLPRDPLSHVDFRRRPAVEFVRATPPGTPKYKARALNGIWATAPYLHNGSVPNLDELLRPAAQRSKSFSIGTRTFDPARVGFVTDAAGFPRFNVNDAAGRPIPGNSNGGHEYGATLSDTERQQLLEYLKTL